MPLTDTTTYTLNVCTDCAEYLRDGHVVDLSGEDITDAIEQAVTERWGGATVLLDAWAGGPEPHFSWLACSGCGSDLGGDRYPATAFVQDLTEGK